MGKWSATHISVQLYIWGPQCSSCQAQFSEHMRQTGNSCLGEKGLANSGQQVHKSQFKNLPLMFFSANLNLERKGQRAVFTFPSPAGAPPRRSGRAGFGKNSHICQLAVRPGSCLQAPEQVGVPEGPILLTINRRGGKMIFSLPCMAGAWLRPLFSRASPTWISLPT